MRRKLISKPETKEMHPPVFKKGSERGACYHLHDNVQVTRGLQHFNQSHDVSMAHAQKHLGFLSDLLLPLPARVTSCLGDGFNCNLITN